MTRVAMICNAQQSDTLRGRQPICSDMPKGLFMRLTAAIDLTVDYEEAARLANEAFPNGSFTGEQLRWLYKCCFSQGGTVVSLRANGRKVGQFVMLRQTINADGVAEPAVQLIDLFVLEEFRSRETLAMLYNEVARQCEIQGIRFAIGMPNERAISANEYFFGLKPQLWLNIRAGLAFPGRLPESLLLNAPYARDQRKYYAKWFEPFEPLPSENGVAWRSDEICERLNNPVRRYGLHMVENLLLISSPRVHRGIPYTLYCGFLARREAKVTSRDFRAVARSAAKLWRRPLWVYPGLHRGLPSLPGWKLSKAVRPSTMLVQLRDFHPEKPPLRWDRYQAIDFDFA